METIIIHDFSELSRLKKSNSIKGNQFRLYVCKRADGKMGTHTLTFSSDFVALYNLGYKFISIAENTLTGELFVIFDKEKGAELKILPSKEKVVGTQKNLVVRSIAELLKIDIKNGVSEVFNMSSNLSKNESNFTFKIKENESNN